MIKIAIIDDEKRDTDELMSCLKRYFSEKAAGEQFDISCFDNAIVFLTNYIADFDLVFFDIIMPHMDGMEAARLLREKDSVTDLIFVTKASSYAVGGYSVEARDFLLKPLSYPNLAMSMDKALYRIRERANTLSLRTPDGVCQLEVYSISRVECEGHKIVYHTFGGERIVWGSLKEQEELLAPFGVFVRINKYCLINLRNVKDVKGSEVFLKDGSSFIIGRSRRDTFMSSLLDYYKRSV